MLVLSRQRDETIMIGDDIEITVVDIRGDKVRVGINAPPRVAVHRKEVYDAIKAENENASRVPGDQLDDVGRSLMDAAKNIPIRPGRPSPSRLTPRLVPAPGTPRTGDAETTRHDQSRDQSSRKRA